MSTGSGHRPRDHCCPGARHRAIETARRVSVRPGVRRRGDDAPIPARQWCRHGRTAIAVSQNSPRALGTGAMALAAAPLRSKSRT